MGRNGHIALSTLGLVIWVLFAYLNVTTALRSKGSLSDVILSPSVLVAIALVCLVLSQLWRFLTGERKENVLNPLFVLMANQSIFGRFILALLCMSLVVGGTWRLLGLPLISGLPDSPFFAALFIAAGVYSGVSALFSPIVRMGLSLEGFEYTLMRPARVLWRDITDVKLRSLLTASWIVLTLKDTTEIRSANPWARWRKVTKVTVNPLMFGIDPEVLKQGIDLRRNISTFD